MDLLLETKMIYIIRGRYLILLKQESLVHIGQTPVQMDL